MVSPNANAPLNPRREPRVVPGPSTEGLAGQMAAGDAEVLGKLYERVAPAVFGWAMLRIPAKLRARIDPEDLLHEVFYRLLIRSDEFDPARGDFRAWTFGFARRVLHEALRSCAREEAGGVREPWTDFARIPDQATSLTGRLVRDEVLLAFGARVDGLAGDERRLLLLRGLEGMEHEEVARELGISTTAAAKRWQRLREDLGADFQAFLVA